MTNNILASLQLGRNSKRVDTVVGSQYVGRSPFSGSVLSALRHLKPDRAKVPY